MEKEQGQQTQPEKPKSYNPFLSPVSEKPYAQMSVEADPTKFQSSIPQPDAVTNRISSSENAYNMLGDMGMGGGSNSGGSGGSGASSSGGANTAFNPAMNNLPNAEKKMGAEQLAKLLVDGYEQLNLLANRGLRISPKKIRKLEAEGEIDLSVQIPYDYGKTIPAGEFIEAINEQNKDTFSVSKEFKKDITPPLIRILEKRGAGLTDEQYVGYLVAKDLGVKIFIGYQILNTMNETLEVIKQYTAAARQGGVVTPPPPQQSGDTEQSVSDTAKYYPTEEIPSTPIPAMPATTTDDNFNFVTNDTFMESSVAKHQLPEDGKAALMRRKKLDRQIDSALQKYSPNKEQKPKTEKRKFGKRGRKPKDYIPKMDEDQIAEALILRETKEPETDKIKGLD
jgi:hypothetical protein